MKLSHLEKNDILKRRRFLYAFPSIDNTKEQILSIAGKA